MEKANIFASLAERGRETGLCDHHEPTQYGGLVYSTIQKSLPLFEPVHGSSAGQLRSRKKRCPGSEMLAPAKVDVIYQGVDMARYGPDAGNPSVAELIGIPTVRK